MTRFAWLIAGLLFGVLIGYSLAPRIESERFGQGVLAGPFAGPCGPL
jgi:hypothetical protein